VLEGRVVPASFTVSNTADAGPGSLRQALLDLNTSADPTNVVTFIPALVGATIGLNSALPTIGKPVDIQGPGAPLLAIDGLHKWRPFDIDPGVSAPPITVGISGLTVEGGYSALQNGGGWPPGTRPSP
jgi:hypothetical protein